MGHQVAAGGDGGEWVAAGQPFGGDDDVGFYIEMFVAPELAGAAKTGLDFIGNQ